LGRVQDVSSRESNAKSIIIKGHAGSFRRTIVGGTIGLLAEECSGPGSHALGVDPYTVGVIGVDTEIGIILLKIGQGLLDVESLEDGYKVLLGQWTDEGTAEGKLIGQEIGIAGTDIGCEYALGELYHDRFGKGCEEGIRFRQLFDGSTKETTDDGGGGVYLPFRGWRSRHGRRRHDAAQSCRISHESIHGETAAETCELARLLVEGHGDAFRRTGHAFAIGGKDVVA